MADPNQPQLTSEGQKLSLRPSCSADADSLFRWIHERQDVLDWVCWSGPASLESYQQALDCPTTGVAPRQDHTLTIVAHEPDGERTPAGTLDLRFSAPGQSGDIGYWIAEPFRRRGLATEAIAQAAELAFEQLGATGLVAGVFVGNEASRRALEANGFRLVQTIRALHRTRGSSSCGEEAATGCAPEGIDEWQFCLLKSSWKRRQKALVVAKNELAGSSEMQRDPARDAD